MNRTAFLFGRTPDLSLVELQALYPSAVLHTAGIGVVEEAVDAVALIHRLGGTVKIAAFARAVPSLTPEDAADVIFSVATDSRITFGISTYGSAKLPSSFVAHVKKVLNSRGATVRFIVARDEHALSSVVVSKQQVVELIVLPEADGYSLWTTAAVQDFEDWNRRDFGRPAVDPKAGMLPPKVARMIVNIALGGARTDRKPMLLDPYCGTGTILSEALLSGVNVTGSDVSEEQVERAKKNISWLRHEYPAQTESLYSAVFVSDATHIRAHLTEKSIDAIATEPYMGETVGTKEREMLTQQKVKNILKGLEKLYIGSLREWASVLSPGARVVMAMPAYVTQRGVMRVKNVVDRCESLGYTLFIEPIEYSRPQAVVRREFFIFQKI